MKKDDLLYLEKAMMMRRLDKDTILHFPDLKGKHVYFLKEGTVKISTHTADGRELIKYIVRPGHLFGEMVLLDGTENDQDHAVALNDCVVCFMDVDHLKAMMNANPELNLRIRKLIGWRIRKLENRLYNMVFKDAPTRVHQYLQDFAQEFGIRNGDHYRVNLILTQDDIAKLTATTRQTVATVMNRLREEGRIQYNQRTLKVFVDPPAIDKG
jgi:CRP/FNR family transcriptional regulator, cyclic AMP receptor protein